MRDWGIGHESSGGGARFARTDVNRPRELTRERPLDTGDRDRDRMEPAKPQLPITKPYFGLNADQSYVAINRSQTQTLSASEILRAPPRERAELLARYGRYLTVLAGTAAGSTSPARPQPFELGKNGFTLKVSAAEISVSDDQGRNFTSGADNKTSLRGEFREGVDGFLFCAFENLLLVDKSAGRQPSAKELDPRVAAAYLSLLGPKDQHKFLTPKLLAYDLNGTAEGRPDIDTITEAFNRMGALSIITTTVSAEGAEKAMALEKAPFTGFHGGDAVRPSHGNKMYGAVAAAYGLGAEHLKAQMVVIGDSNTDAPNDLSDVLFIQNDARTPAQALMILLSELDRRGQGSFLDGLKAMAQKPSVGPLSFTIETRSPGQNKVPVISNLNVHFALNALQDALISTAADPVGKATAELGRWWMMKRDVASFASIALELVKTPAKAAVKKEIERRQERRREAISAGKETARLILRDSRTMSQGEFFNGAETPALLGDQAVLDTIKAASVAFLANQQRTHADRRQTVADHTAKAKTKVDELIQAAGDEPEVFLPRFFLERLVPGSKSDRERWLQVLDQVIAKTEDGSAQGEPVRMAVLRDYAQQLDTELARFDATEAALAGRVEALLHRGSTAVSAATEAWTAIGRAYAG